MWVDQQMIQTRTTGDMVLFAEVVHAGTITGGSKRLGLERSTVSRRITSLESRLGVSLLERSTRRLKLTEAGETYYKHCLRVVEAAQDAEAAARGFQVDPSGTLRIAAVLPDADHWMADLIAGFMDRHTNVCIQLKLFDSIGLAVAEHPDLLLANDAANETSDGVAIGTISEALWSTPGFLRASNLNGSPEGLRRVSTIGLAGHDAAVRWRLSTERDRIQLETTPRLRVSSLRNCLDSCVAGLGVAKLPVYLCQAAEARGDLVRLYPEWQVEGMPLLSLSGPTSQLPRKARYFVDYLSKTLG